MEMDIIEQIEIIMDEEVRPQLKEHHGDVRVLSCEDGICRIRLLGQCSGCPSARLTTEELIGKTVMDKLPQIKDVVLVQETSDELLDFAKKLLYREL